MTNLVGQTINQYQITEHLGDGGMAYVYKAYHPGLDVYRAIKIIRPEFVNQPGFKERFQREAQAVARLRHSNIVQIHDYGVHNNLYYMVMEFIEGQDLKDYLKQHGAIRPFSQVVNIIEQIASALHYAHRQGILHRDIKPANIMLTPRHEVILTDFGIAKILQQETQEGAKTEVGVSIGTPAYMAPEQARGLAEVGPTADIYSLGIVLYQMLTGRVPYMADTPLAVILKVINDPLPPPRSFSPDIPDVLQGVVLKATAKNPTDRYQTAEAMVDGLKRSLDPTSTLSGTTVKVITPPAKSSLPLLWIGAGVILAIIICMILFGVMFGPSVTQAVSILLQTPTPTPLMTPTSTPTAVPPTPTQTVAPPTATATVIPSTPTPSVTVSNTTIPVEWPLGDGLTEFSDTKYFGSIVDGRYIWKATTVEGVATGISAITPIVSNFVFQTDIRIIEGRANTLYGLNFREGDEGSYDFLIQNDGHFLFRMWSWEAEKYDYIVEWEKSSAIRNDQPNRLKVVAQGSKIQLFINDKLVVDTVHEGITTGNLGFATALDQDQSITFEISNYSLTLLQ